MPPVASGGKDDVVQRLVRPAVDVQIATDADRPQDRHCVSRLMRTKLRIARSSNLNSDDSFLLADVAYAALEVKASAFQIIRPFMRQDQSLQNGQNVVG